VRSCTRTGLRLALVLAIFVLPAIGRADNPTALRSRGARLDTAERSARLELFALETRLTQARSELANVEARLATVEHQHSSARRQLVVARHVLAVAEQRLAEQVRLLYVFEQPDALSILLGAASIEDAIDSVDALRRSADATNGVLDEAKAARGRVIRLLGTLSKRRIELRRLRATAAARAADLEQATAGRAAYIARLQAERVLNQQQIAEAFAAAQAAQASATIETAKADAAPSISSIGAQTVVESAPAVVESAPAPVPLPPLQPSPQASVPTSGETLRVIATAYTLRGSTATGIPAGPGVVAVDPTVIPLGTRMTIPGYGEGVAADTGGSIRGLRIDLWVATTAEAAQWNWKPLTITLH
jgi:3D (Asp-Asp-Asp) domain-containing protein/peptidoglycan hydrolase CwlO-like protein